MNTTEILHKFDEITNHYFEELETYSLEELTRKPGENEWSLGQMYMHLIRSAQGMQLGSIDKIRSIAAEPAAATAGKTEAGEQVFTLGGFPPVSIQVPASPQYTPGQPLSKEEITQGLEAVRQRMKEVEPLLSQLSGATSPHPRLGELSAVEWFALIEMHYRHHLLQKERLKAFLAS